MHFISLATALREATHNDAVQVGSELGALPYQCLDLVAALQVQCEVLHASNAPCHVNVAQGTQDRPSIAAS